MFGEWKRNKCGGDWKNVWDMSKKKRILVSTKQKEKIDTNIWVDIVLRKKELKRLDVKKHLGLVENRSRPRMKGTLLVLGALY